jgi:hypothetical protein
MLTHYYLIQRKKCQLIESLLFGIEQTEQLKEFALSQQLRNIMATEQGHAMDLKQALGK